MRRLTITLLALVVSAGLAFASVPLGDWGAVVTPGIDGTGGPDAYGYTWIDSDEPGGPVLNWIDITGTGTLVTGLGDDNYVGPFDIGFPFHYYWYDVTQYYIGSNGYLKFGSPYNMAQPFPATIPMASAPNDFVGVYIADWYPGQLGQGSVYRWTNNVDSMIVSFIDIPEWTTTPPAGHHHFQVILTDTDSSLTFQYGTQSGLVSNNDQLVGIENINGLVGLLHSTDFYIASNYVVLFEYPDVVTYVVHDMATASSANENSEGFFVLNSDVVQPWAKVKNAGNQVASTFTVSCLIENELGVPQYYEDVIGGPLNPGEELEVTFPTTWTPTTNGQYFFQCAVNLVGDMNPNNDEKRTECHVLTLPGDLLYDDGTSEQGWSWMGGDGGLGQRFVPPTYPVTLSNLQYYIGLSTTPTFIAAVYDDDGPEGIPGTELFSQLAAVAVTGWYTVDVPAIEITEGAFYVAWHMTGENTTTCGTDNTLERGSRQSWEYTGVWAPYRNAETTDVMIRTNIYQPGAVPNVTTTLTPYNPPIQIPATGGSFDFNISVTNGEATPQTFDFWTDVTLPNGNPFGPIIGPLNDFTLPGTTTIERDRTQDVPANAPPGTYYYNSYVGDYPDDIWNSDNFPFEKLLTPDGAPVSGWTCSGESFEQWVSQVEVVIPAEFAVSGAYPNPFNPATQISFSLPVDSKVMLTVYDVSGRQVAALVDGYRAAGVHDVTFDASNLASGIYVYIISAGDFTASGKMVLLK